jgi:anti-sigma factor RsiW
MKHPTEEEWMSYLYDDANVTERAALTAHLAECADCAARIGEWQVTQKNLDDWRLDPQATKPRVLERRNRWRQPALTWAAAAALVLAVGFGLGRMTSAASVEKARAELRQEFAQLRSQDAEFIRAELDKAASANLAASDNQTRTLLADYASAVDLNLAEEHDAIYAALDKMDAQRVTDYVALKKDLDTVAVLTDAGLRRTQQELIQLADAAQPVAASHPLTK